MIENINRIFLNKPFNQADPVSQVEIDNEKYRLKEREKLVSSKANTSLCIMIIGFFIFAVCGLLFGLYITVDEFTKYYLFVCAAIGFFMCTSSKWKSHSNNLDFIKNEINKLKPLSDKEAKELESIFASTTDFNDFLRIVVAEQKRIITSYEANKIWVQNTRRIQKEKDLLKSNEGNKTMMNIEEMAKKVSFEA